MALHFAQNGIDFFERAVENIKSRGHLAGTPAISQAKRNNSKKGEKT